MRIESHNVGADRLNNIGGAQQIGGSAAGKASEHRSSSTDGVDLSRRAKEIRSAQKAIDTLTNVREDRVVALKAQIEAGQFNPSPEDIAQKILGV